MYAPFTKKRGEMYHLIKNMVRMPRPLPPEIFEVRDMSKRCMFHQFYGHSTEECQQLRDILEKMAREGRLVDYIRPSFYDRHRKLYGGEKEFKKPTQYKKGYMDPRNNQRTQDSMDGSEPRNRQKSIDINVISGGDLEAQPEKSNRIKSKPYPTVLSVEQTPDRKRPRSEEMISFSGKDFGDVKWPHADPLVLRLKMGEHRVNRVLVDTGSSADILYLSAFQKMKLQFCRPQDITTPLTGFTGDTLQPKGVV